MGKIYIYIYTYYAPRELKTTFTEQFKVVSIQMDAIIYHFWIMSTNLWVFAQPLTNNSLMFGYPSMQLAIKYVLYFIV